MKKPVTNTLASFKASHDKSTIFADKIREGLKQLAAEGDEAWENDGDFIRRCGMSPHQFPKFHNQFKDHIVAIARSGNSRIKRVWFGDKRVAAKARAMEG